MLSKVADFFEQEVDDAVAGLSQLLEPLIMVVLGTVIGGLVVAMYLPIFKLGPRSSDALAAIILRDPVAFTAPPACSACSSAASSTS